MKRGLQIYTYQPVCHPFLRIDGEMQTTTLAPLLEQSQIKRLVYGFMSDRQIGLFEKNSEIDLAWELSSTLALGLIFLNSIVA